MIQNYKKNKSVQIYNRIFLLFHSFLPFIPIPGTFFHAKKHTLFLFPFTANSSLTIPHFRLIRQMHRQETSILLIL